MLISDDMKAGEDFFKKALARTDGWVTPDRIRDYALMFLVLFYGLWLFWILTGSGMLDRRGTIIGSDFLTAYSGSLFAHTDNPGRAYGLEEFSAMQNHVAGSEVKPLMWRYPPPAFILFWPLCLLPYLPACFLWLIVTAYAFYRTIHFLIPRRMTLLLFLSYAGFYQNWIQGQNALFTGALLCGGLLRAEKHPWQGGFLLGLLIYKPQFGFLAMLLLLLRKEWLAFLVASFSGLLLFLISFEAYGMKPWMDFRESLPLTMLAVQGGFDPIHKLITFFGALVLVGVPGNLALSLASIFSAGIGISCIVYWVKAKDRLAAIALTVCGTLLITPYAYDYEFVIMAFPLAWLIADSEKRGWLGGGKTFCVFAWFAPFLIPPLAFITHIQLGFLVVLGLFLLIWQRTFLSTLSASK